MVQPTQPRVRDYRGIGSRPLLERHAGSVRPFAASREADPAHGSSRNHAALFVGVPHSGR